MAFVKALNTETGLIQNVPARYIDNPNCFGGVFTRPDAPRAKKPKAPKAPPSDAETADTTTNPAAVAAPATKE